MMKVKIVFKNTDGVDDIRRLPSRDAFAFKQVVDFVETTYPALKGTEFTIKYSDDEGDTVTIGSDVELAEALRVAETEQRKSLKLFVEADTNEETKQAEPKNQSGTGGTSAAPTGALPTHEELRNLFALFQADVEAQAAMPAAIEVVLSSVRNGATLHDAVLLALEAAPALAETPLIKAVRPFLPQLCARAQPFVPMIVAFAPQALTAGLPQLFSMFSSFGAFPAGGNSSSSPPPFDLASLLNQFAPCNVPPSSEPTEDEEDEDEEDDDSDVEDEDDENAPSVHFGIVCDGCEKGPIEGVRFKCQVCPDFDLCESCEAQNKHPADHTMIKLKVPQEMWWRRGGSRGRGGCGSWRRRGAFNPFRRGGAPRRGGGGGGHHHHGHRHHHGRRDRRVGLPRADFVSDVTVPDRCVVSPDQTLVKTWRLKNAGQIQWPEGSTITFVKGCKDIIVESSFPVKAAMPGEEVEVSVVLRTPSTPGRYVTYFRLRTPHTKSENGTQFGQRVWVDFDVAVEDMPHPPSAPAENSEPVDCKDGDDNAPVADDDKQPATAVAAADDDGSIKYAAQLTLLEGMGFLDRSLNLFLLNDNDGNLQAVVQTILNRS